MPNPPRSIVPVGTKFNRWTILEIIHSYGSTTCRALCSCGTEKTVSLSSIKQGRSKSCGCLRNEAVTKHGLSSVSSYNVWKGMIQRTTNPLAEHWEDYGGRGITVCEDWKVFEHFYRDMGEKPLGLELDRIKNHLGYNKENCQWVTKVQNMRNKRSNILIEYEGQWITIAEASELSGVLPSTISRRIKRGLVGKELFK